MWVILAMPFQGMLAHKFGSQQTDAAALIAMAVAAALLVSVVMPSEYGIDPTGVGSALGLKEMGEIKQSLAAEAAQDALASTAPQVALAAPAAPAAPIVQPAPAVDRKHAVSGKSVAVR